MLLIPIASGSKQCTLLETVKGYRLSIHTPEKSFFVRLPAGHALPYNLDAATNTFGRR